MSSQRHACVPKHTAILQNRVPASNMNNRASAIVFAYLHDACWSSWRRSERVTVTAMLLNSAQSWIYAGLTLVDDLGHFAVIFWRVFGFDAHRKWSSTRVCVGCQRKNWRWTVETPAGCSLRKFLVRDRVSRITYTSTRSSCVFENIQSHDDSNRNSVELHQNERFKPKTGNGTG